MKDKRVYLRFEGVGQEAEIYINEKRVEKHIGGYSAFCIEVTNYIKEKKAIQIAVKVTNESNFKRIPINDKLFNHYGGIYRSVQLFATAKTNIKPNYYGSTGTFVTLKTQETDKATVEIKSHLSSKKLANAILATSLKNDKNEVVTQKEIALNQFSKDTVVSTIMVIKNPQYWQARNNPYLYQADITIQSGEEKDQIEQSFGLKSFTVDPEKGFILNKQLYRLYGVCMHQEWQKKRPSFNAKTS